MIHTQCSKGGFRVELKFSNCFEFWISTIEKREMNMSLHTALVYSIQNVSVLCRS
jgi:hypothetical protein